MLHADCTHVCILNHIFISISTCRISVLHEIRVYNTFPINIAVVFARVWIMLGKAIWIKGWIIWRIEYTWNCLDKKLALKSEYCFWYTSQILFLSVRRFQFYEIQKAYKTKYKKTEQYPVLFYYASLDVFWEHVYD